MQLSQITLTYIHFKPQQFHCYLVQRDLSITITKSWINTIFDEQVHHWHMTRVCCTVYQWYFAWPCLHINICSLFQEQLTDLSMASAAGIMLWRRKKVTGKLPINHIHRADGLQFFQPFFCNLFHCSSPVRINYKLLFQN